MAIEIYVRIKDIYLGLFQALVEKIEKELIQ